MTMTRITLQNSPTPAGVVETPVSFDSGGATLHGVLYAPAGGAADGRAAVVTGAWTTVKEQMAGTYARALAARGRIALVFDFTGWGQSEGTPRYVEDPAVKTADIAAAAAFLAGRDGVDPAQMTGVGVCASSGYMADATADGVFARVALVAPWLHDPALAETIYGGPEMAAQLIASSAAAGDAQIAASADDDSAVMFQAPYYTEPDRGLIAAYDNRFSALSWKPWLTYDAQKSADRLTRPMLMVGSPGIALPAGAVAYEARMTAPLEKIWLGDDVSQFDFYDRADAVNAAADAVAAFMAA